MTKDRLKEMKRLMMETGGNDGEEVKGKRKEKPSPLVAFCENMRSVKLEIEELKGKLKNLKILLGDNQLWANDDATRREVERKIEEEKLVIGNAAKTIRKKLKSMRNSPSNEEKTSVILRIKEIQINAALKELNDTLRDYLSCLQQQKERSFKILKDMIEVKGDNVNDLEALLEEGKIAIFTNNLLIDDNEEKSWLREAEGRRDNILKVESTILEIRNLFNELSLVVDIQQEKIDEVSKLVDDNLIRVESARKKISSTRKKKEKIRYRKLMVGLICTSVILVVVILLIVI